jgi:hypothetical protein
VPMKEKTCWGIGIHSILVPESSEKRRSTCIAWLSDAEVRGPRGRKGKYKTDADADRVRVQKPVPANLYVPCYPERRWGDDRDVKPNQVELNRSYALWRVSTRKYRKKKKRKAIKKSGVERAQAKPSGDRRVSGVAGFRSCRSPRVS